MTAVLKVTIDKPNSRILLTEVKRTINEDGRSVDTVTMMPQAYSIQEATQFFEVLLRQAHKGYFDPNMVRAEAIAATSVDGTDANGDPLHPLEQAKARHRSDDFQPVKQILLELNAAPNVRRLIGQAIAPGTKSDRAGCELYPEDDIYTMLN